MERRLTNLPCVVFVDATTLQPGEKVAVDVCWPAGFVAGGAWPADAEAYRGASVGGWPVGGNVVLRQRVTSDASDLGHVLDGAGTVIGRVVAADGDTLTVESVP